MGQPTSASVGGGCEKKILNFLRELLKIKRNIFLHIYECKFCSVVDLPSAYVEKP